MARITTIIFLAALAFSSMNTFADNREPPHAATPRRIAIIVRQLSPIAFGTFASTGSGGTITIDAASGARRVAGAINVLSGGDYGQAEFAIIGQPGEEILVTPPASTILGRGGSGSDMLITGLQVSPTEVITLDRQGNAKIKIGGILKVPGAAAQGYYNGFFDVTVRYLK